jgi:hypothetical protein
MGSLYFQRLKLGCKYSRVGAQSGSRNVNIPQTVCCAATTGIEDVATAKKIAFKDSTGARCQKISRVHAAMRKGCYLQASLSYTIEGTLPVCALATFDCAWEKFPRTG